MQLSTLLLMSRSAVDRQVSDFPPFFSYVPKLPTRTGYARCSTIVITREQFTVSLPVHIFSHLCFYLSLRQLVIPNSLSHFPPQKKQNNNNNKTHLFHSLSSSQTSKRKTRSQKCVMCFTNNNNNKKWGWGTLNNLAGVYAACHWRELKCMHFFPPVSGIPR